VVVEEVERELGSAAVYNLEVEEYHTYFVGSEEWGFSVWAHNACQGLPGANAPEGEALATRAKDLYRGLTYREKASCTIGVTRVNIDGQSVEVASMNGLARQSAVQKIRAVVERGGGIFEQAPGSGHPDTHLYERFSGYEGFQAIGISHWRGPCPELCRPFFRRRSFPNVYWDDTYVP
jgi:hypothetical protein